MLKITKNFTLAEMTHTNVPLPNKPDTQQLLNLCWGCHVILQPIRDFAKCPITITSGFRSKDVNVWVGGVSNSQHLSGCAADCVVAESKMDDVLDFITLSLPFDQLLVGKSFFHVSWVPFGSPRKQRINNYYDY